MFRRAIIYRASIAAVLCLACRAHAESPRFSTDIKPILSNKCFACHGPDEKSRKANFRLDIEADARKKLIGDHGRASVPASRNPHESSALLAASAVFARITAEKTEDRMPPADSGKALNAAEIAKLRAWIEAGAKYETHWAFSAPTRPALPALRDPSWARNDIDRFILARLEKQNLRPSPEADRITLLRRVYLDLTGLPPKPADVQAFLLDNSLGAYERVVDALLASPHFGERWARHWLDAAHYADSNGYSVDSPRSIWRYRDWVIDAINKDLPFDQFVTQQLAGDLLPDATDEQRIATGFLRNTMINEEGGIDKEEFRQEAVIDRVNTFGTVMLGLTLGCAKCHTHKYDPIEQREYYKIFAFFNNDDEVDLKFDSPGIEKDKAESDRKNKKLRKDLETYLDGAAETRKAWEAKLDEAFLKGLTEDERNTLKTPWDQRDKKQTALALKLFRANDAEAKAREEAIKAERNSPKSTTMIVAARKEPRETHLRIQGDYTRPSEVVTPGGFGALHAMPAGAATRLDLARWLTAPEDPLFARVTVNRLWQHLFGRGIVETEDDFGTQGTPPSHPELLDWLAVEFVAHDWSVKALLREIVTSATYRQASTQRPELGEVDPRNILLARQNRVRLDAEIIRDTALAAAGVLNEKVGGPSVFPPQPDGVMTQGQQNRPWKASDGEDRYRRGLYTYFWRATPHPALTVFDAPDAQSACTRRVNSNTPLQALTLLNDAAYVEMAEALSKRIAAEGGPDPAARMDYAFKTCLARTPKHDETEILRSLFETERSATGEDIAWKSVARAMLNLDEFITRE